MQELTIMIPRIVFLFIVIAILTLVIKVVLIGQPRDGQLSGGRKACMKFWYRLSVYVISGFTFFMRLKYEYQTLDDVHFYQEYVGHVLKRRMTRRNTLGFAIKESESDVWLRDVEGGLIVDADSQISDESIDAARSSGNLDSIRQDNMSRKKVPKRGPGRVAVIVCNHLGWPEIFNLIASPIFPGFTPKKEIVNLPFAGKLAIGLSSLFVSRGANPEEREKVVEEIVARQKLIEVDNLPYQPFCVFAEGTTSNGTHILPFKRGAFAGMRTVQPCFVNLTSSAVRPCYDILDLRELMILLCSRFSCVTSTLTIMPPFMPNDKMLELHSDKGETDWEIFAWCVRDAISKASGLKKFDKGSMRQCKTYWSLYSGNAKEVELEGKTWTSDMFGNKGYVKMPEEELNTDPPEV